MSIHLSRMLGIKHPILLAPMAGVSTPELAAQISNTGGLGSLGLGASSVSQVRQLIMETQKLTSKPFQVNFFCHKSEPLDIERNQAWIKYLKPEFDRIGAKAPSELKCIYPSFLDNDDFLDIVLELKPKAVSFHFGVPLPHQMEKLKKNGILTLVSVTSLVEGFIAQTKGVDILVAQGVEAGGHRGTFNPEIVVDSGMRTLDLVDILTKHIDIPIVAAGGIMDGYDAVNVMKKGAAGIQMGTAFLLSSTSAVGKQYREALLKRGPTFITSAISGRPARSLFTRWSLLDCPELITDNKTTNITTSVSSHNCSISDTSISFNESFNRPIVAPYPYAYDLAKQLNTSFLNTNHRNNNDTINDIFTSNSPTEISQGYGAFWAGVNVNRIREIEANILVESLVSEMESSGM